MTDKEEIASLNPQTSSTAIVFDQHDYDHAEYFSVLRHLRKSFYNDRGYLNGFLKSKFNFFQRTSANILSPFENLLVSNKDKSAIISLIIRKYKLWNDEMFWTKTINLKEVMNQFAINSSINIKNLFSTLMYDWYHPNEETTHALCEKFEAYAACGSSLFIKLFEIVDDEQHKGYEYICLRIIYHYLHERKIRLNEGNFYERTLFQDEISYAINGVLTMKNDEYRTIILKILVVFMDHTNDDNYLFLKDKVLENVKYNFEPNSVYRVKYESIEKHCDEKFFNLAFLLKENRLKKFEFQFDDFIKTYRKYYGEYWNIAIKSNARLLHHIGEEQCDVKLLKTIEFIFKKCPFIELNSTILTTFEEVAEYYIIFNEPLDKEEELFLKKTNELLRRKADEFDMKCIKSKLFNRKLLFGRKSVNHKSLLEEILCYPRLYPVVNTIWDKFKLYEKPELLTLKNPMGNPLIYYICKAGVNQIVDFLLLPRIQKWSCNFDKPKYYTVIQNSQIYSITGKSIIEHQVDIYLGIEQSENEIFSVVIYLLEEIGTIHEITNDEVINHFIDISRQTDTYSHELFEIDDLLGIIAIYWTPHQGQYDYYKQILIENNPFFCLLFMVIEKRQEEFFEKFETKFDKLEESYEHRYDVSVTQRENNEQQFNELYSSNFLFILFLAAMRTNQHKIIDSIFKNDSFVTISFGFPENVKPTEIHYYAALNLLKHNHELGRSNIPDDWLTKEVFEEFLDSRITYKNQQFIEIDCTNFIHAETQKTKVRGFNDLTDKILMLEDTTSLAYIKDQENLRKLITHPVVETYINLKSFKYQRIFTYNFWAFILLYILPFSTLIFKNHFQVCEESNWNSFIKIQWHYIGIIFLIIRETFQGIVAGSFINYIRQRSNIFDTTLIFLSITLSICSPFKEAESFSGLNLLEVILILFTTICATSLLPLSYVPINMEILKKVSMTFLKIFYTFAIILIAFSFSFCIMFEEQFRKKINQTEDEPLRCNFNKTESEQEDKNDEMPDGTISFEYPHTSLLKILIMLSGEYSIEPATLTFFQLSFFAFFVVASFILFNLILGLSIEDVQELKNGSRQFNLITKAKKLINVGEKLEMFFNFVNDYKGQQDFRREGKLEAIKESLIDVSLLLVRFFLSKYIYIHSIQKIYINLKTKKVFVKVNRKYESILAKSAFKRDDDYEIDDNMLEKIQDIINVKNKKMFKNFKTKMQMEEKKQHMD